MIAMYCLTEVFLAGTLPQKLPIQISNDHYRKLQRQKVRHIDEDNNSDSLSDLARVNCLSRTCDQLISLYKDFMQFLMSLPKKSKGDVSRYSLGFRSIQRTRAGCSSMWEISDEFNVVVSNLEYLSRAAQNNQAMKEFVDNIFQCGLKSIPITGSTYTLLGTIEDSLSQPITGLGILAFNIKLRRLKSCMRECNKNVFGDIFPAIKIAEAKVLLCESRFEDSQMEEPSYQLHAAQASLVSCL
ncbi:hypothetical protein ACH5RR_041052 [Cinchona calisaya]|uniref:Uncharacterized protein n=1 Tax=Cinchona calisaya TaxID=153742 RepID=A0ABD2XVV3_9GENT